MTIGLTKISQENVVKFLKRNISKVGKRWEGEEYEAILAQDGFHDKDLENYYRQQQIGYTQRKPINAHFDDMDNGHRKQLSSILTIILYHKSQNLK